jgi:hypothetical protein
MFLKKLKATPENLRRVAAFCRDEEVVPPLDEHEELLLDAITSPHKLTPLGRVTLGRAHVTHGVDLYGKGEIPVGTVTEDYVNPDGIWLEYTPI